MSNQSNDDIRESIIGLGERSVRKSYYPQLKKKIEEVEELNRTLEEKVEERTKELEHSLESLKQTQKKLIESEKMASLGSLVAGVAHEINTPIGIGLTGITHFIEASKTLEKKYKNDTMSEEDFEDFLAMTKNISEMINVNLKKTAQLVNSFKQISVDQTSEEKREFKILKYTNEILLSLNSVIKKQSCEIDISCDENIIINSYPGAYSQIITNLIINSILHGFQDIENGKISIVITKTNNKINLIYKDNGKGIKEENLDKIFDPFFTTLRNKGGTGLGLNILYNIITNTLNGSIECKSQENHGVEFNILFEI